MKKVLFILIFICFVYLNASATNLRGQVVRYDSYYQRYFPLPRVRVDFIYWNGAQWINPTYAITGGDGFYYFLNINPGTIFKVVINSNLYPNQPLTVAYINYPYYQDIPFISI